MDTAAVGDNIKHDLGGGGVQKTRAFKIHDNNYYICATLVLRGIFRFVLKIEIFRIIVILCI